MIIVCWQNAVCSAVALLKTTVLTLEDEESRPETGLLGNVIAAVEYKCSATSIGTSNDLPGTRPTTAMVRHVSIA